MKSRVHRFDGCKGGVMVKKLLRGFAGLLFGAGLLAISAADSSATYVPFTQITNKGEECAQRAVPDKINLIKTNIFIMYFPV